MNEVSNRSSHESRCKLIVLFKPDVSETLFKPIKIFRDNLLPFLLPYQILFCHRLSSFLKKKSTNFQLKKETSPKCHHSLLKQTLADFDTIEERCCIPIVTSWFSHTLLYIDCDLYHNASDLTQPLTQEIPPKRT